MAAVTNKQNEDVTLANNDNAAVESQQYYQAILEQYQAGEITDESIKESCEKQGVNADYILNFVHMSNIEREKSNLYKSDLSDKSEYPIQGKSKSADLKPGDSVTIAGCTITCSEVKYGGGVFGIGEKTKKMYHCESDYLGSFDYDPQLFSVGYKNVKESDGSISTLPILEYTGPADPVEIQSDNNWAYNFSKGFLTPLTWLGVMDEEDADSTAIFHQVVIPNGVKHLDYTFSGRDDLKYIPYRIPASVESMHCAFKDCSSAECFPDNTLFKGKKRNLYLPSTLQDGSQAFEGCTKLGCDVYSIDYEAYSSKNDWDKFWSEVSSDLLGNYGTEYKDQLSHDLENATCMFYGCEAMSQEYATGVWWWEKDDEDKVGNHKKANYGGELTPYLAPNTVRDIYGAIAETNAGLNNEKDGLITDESQLKYWSVDNTEFLTQADGSINSAFLAYINSVDAETKSKIEEAQANQYTQTNGKVAAEHVDTSVEVVNDGHSTNNLVKVDGVSEFDATGHKLSEQAKLHTTSSFWETVAVDGATGLGIFGVTDIAMTALLGKTPLAKIPGLNTKISAVTGLVAGVAGVGLLEYKDKLPGSLYPIVAWTAEKLPDGPIKDKLWEFADSLPTAEAYKWNAQAEGINEQLPEWNKQWDNEFVLAQGNYEKRLSSLFNQVTDNISNGFVSDEHVNNTMKSNGTACAQEMSFYAVAYNGEESAKCVYDVVNTTVTAARDSYESRIAESGCTDAIKADMKDYYTDLMVALESYNAGSIEGIKTYAGDGTPLAKLEQEGLNMTNRAYAQAVMESLKELDGKYHFMDDAAWEQVQTLNIDGIDIANIKSFNDVSYFDSAKVATKANVETHLANVKEWAEQNSVDNVEGNLNELDIMKGVSDHDKEKLGIATDTSSSANTSSSDKVSSDTIAASLTGLSVNEQADSDEVVLQG